MGFRTWEKDMKICLISSVDKDVMDGSTARPLNISENLAELGCEIMHICFELPKQIENIAHIIKYDKSVNKAGKLINILKWYNEVKTFSPDVIYTHQLFNTTIAIPLKYLLKIPLVCDCHGSAALHAYPNKKIVFWEKMVLKTADKVIVAANDVKEVFTGCYGMPKDKIKTIENGTNTDLFKPTEKNNRLKEKYGLANQDRVVIFTCPRGLPANDLALRYFFDLVPIIESKIKYIKFVIIGGGPQLDPPSPNIIYTGFVQDLASFINLGDVCIAPYPASSVCGTAGAKNKIIEYFACGKPVISTEEGIRGFDDAVPDHDFILARDLNDFVDKFVTVLNDKKISTQLGENARKISLKYSWANLSKEVLKILDSAAEEIANVSK